MKEYPDLDTSVADQLGFMGFTSMSRVLSQNLYFQYEVLDRESRIKVCDSSFFLAIGEASFSEVIRNGGIIGIYLAYENERKFLLNPEA